MIVQLGAVQFTANELGYDTLEKVRNWEWTGVDIIGDYPILQFTGKTAELNLEGVVWTYSANDDTPKDLVDLADDAEPQGLTDDLGNFYGFWVIVSLSRAERHFRAEQKLGLNTRWNLRLRYYGETKDRGVV